MSEQVPIVMGREDEQEDLVPEHRIFDPVEPECNDVGKTDGNNDEFENFNAPPQSLQVLQGSGDEDEGRDELRDGSRSAPAVAVV